MITFAAMRILVLGGTLFLGRHCVDAARARGHRVTIFNRGTRRGLWPDVEERVGDRDGALDGGLDALGDERWDAVIDPSGYVPRLVGASARRLADRVGHYTFVSSVSVYRDLAVAGLDERSPVLAVDDEANEDVAAHYGALKALCERAAEAAMPGRVLNVRAGLLVGPFDPSGRFTYWVRRVPRGGEVLAPGSPDRAVQFVDARDVAEWIVAMAESRGAGTFNATGPASPTTMGDVLDACRDPAGDARFTWVDDRFLAAEEVAPFTELPLWLPPSAAGLLAVDVAKASAAGLRTRPLADTIADTTRWLRGAAEAAPATLASGGSTKAGLDPDRERALLERWHARAGEPHDGP